MRRAAKRDIAEKPIVEALRRIGADVCRLDEPCDLLVGYKRRNVLIEVKSSGGTLTKRQKDFFASWRGEAYIVQTVDQAIKAIGK